jgi:hypothetical protein
MSIQIERRTTFAVSGGIFGVGSLRDAAKRARDQRSNRRVAYRPLDGLAAHGNSDQLHHRRGCRARRGDLR